MSNKVSGQWTKQTKIEQLYPTPRAVDPSLPSSAKTYLEQAHQTLHAPDAAAVMAASAVDAMLKQHDLKDGSLYARIDKAVQQHVLTEGMGKWAHAVRLEANNVRHADEENRHLTRQQAEQVVEFATALGEFLFVLTSKIEKGVAEAQAAPTTGS